MVADTRPERLAARFERAAQDHYGGGESPLYQQMARLVARSEAILGRLHPVSGRRQLVGLYFAAIHQLILSGVSHSLRAAYPLGGEHRGPLSDDDLAEMLEDFTERYVGDLLDTIRSRTLQTNNPRRGAVLHAALELLPEPFSERFDLVEIGASAGFNMLADFHRYSYTDDGREVASAGSGRSGCCFPCEAPEARWLPAGVLPVGRRLPVDVRPLRCGSATDALWLESLVYPDDTLALRSIPVIRGLMQSLGIECLRVAADGAVRETASLLDGTVPLVILTCCVGAQMTCSAHEKLLADASLLARSRDIVLIGIEPASTAATPSRPGEFMLTFTRFPALTESVLGTAHMNGTWMSLLPEACRIRETLG